MDCGRGFELKQRKTPLFAVLKALALRHPALPSHCQGIGDLLL